MLTAECLLSGSATPFLNDVLGRKPDGQNWPLAEGLLTSARMPVSATVSSFCLLREQFSHNRRSHSSLNLQTFLFSQWTRACVRLIVQRDRWRDPACNCSRSVH